MKNSIIDYKKMMNPAVFNAKPGLKSCESIFTLNIFTGVLSYSLLSISIISIYLLNYTLVSL